MISLSKITAFIITLLLALMFDLVINAIIGDMSGWKLWAINLGKFSIGWFFGRDVYKNILNKTQE